jgi:hypothetical protein
LQLHHELAVARDSEQIPPTSARNSCSGGIEGRPISEYSGRQVRRIDASSISGLIAAALYGYLVYVHRHRFAGVLSP